MSDIKVGDLVMVVRPASCGCDNSIGSVFNVINIRRYPQIRCLYCDTRRDFFAASVFGNAAYGRINVNRLKRIPPLEELDRTQAMDPADVLAWHRERANG